MWFDSTIIINILLLAGLVACIAYYVWLVWFVGRRGKEL